MLIISLTVFFSVVFTSNSSVLAAVGGCAMLSYVIGFWPKVKAYVPTHLTDGNSLIYGISTPEEYFGVLVITLVLTVACFSISIPLFNKKHL